MKTARFWVPHGETYVKLTLREGESRHHSRGGPTDEGWSRESNRWTFDDGIIVHESTFDGVDCDGRLTQHFKAACPVAELAANTAYYDPTIRVPAWKEVSHRQRDYSAEAMGY